MSAADADRSKRTRRAAPITKHTAQNGTKSYWFQADVGTKPDGSRDRRRFTYRTLTEARKEWHRITAEVAAGTYAKATTLTVDEACDQWLAGRRGVRRVTLEGYRNDLKPVRRHLGGKKLQQLTKADGDSLVEWMLTAGRQSPRHYRPESLAGRVAAVIAAHPEGISSRELAAAFPADDVHTCLSGLVRAGRVARPRRAVYVLAAQPPGGESDDLGGVGVVSVRSTLTRFTAVVQSFVDQGVLPRNVIALVERPKDGHRDDSQAREVGECERTAKSWTVAEVQQFREAARGHRLYACWLLSMYGLRRSEVLGLRWSDIDGEILRIRQGRVAVGTETVEGAPKSRRSRRDLPLPGELTEALRSLKTRQKSEALALGVEWSDDRLIAVQPDTGPVRHEWFSDEFHRLRKAAGLRRIHLKGLRNTSVSLMLDQHHPVHIVAAWHGHDPAVSLSIYSDAKADELKAASTALFG
ncbi:site-specific integrase [Mycobacterium sp. SMC-8]|uniref:site-specific integrase n=1 Tax=Mycobacterium sp. SMC-8 TaxID=2857060 RepID=UPI0021B2E39E|nr:site-specific integrase [Mycobacterium sp. SMC-8]UXA10750.1 site-specific integrase [Mycobacterium sp. SMC-8]